LTARQELRPSRPSCPPGRIRARLDGLPDRGVFDRAPDWRPTSDAPYRPPREPGIRRASPGALGSLPPRARQSPRFSRPEAPFLDRCPEEPATVLAVSPPTIRLPTLVHSSSLSREGLGLEPSSFHPKGLATERRLSTSAIDSIRDHDLGHDRTPLTAHAIACLCSSSRAFASQLGSIRRVASTPRDFSLGQSQPRFQGTGAEDESSATPTTIARAESVTPTHVARTPHVASRWSHRRGLPVRPSMVDHAPYELASRRRSRDFASRMPSLSRRLLEGPPLARSREGASDTLHPRCLPSTDVPVGG
jgi:hypothetical protein